MKKNNPVVHFEMAYKDSERLTNFYSQAFGWEMIKLGPEMGDYVTAQTAETDENRMIKTPGTINGGFFLANPDTQPQCPSVVIAVDKIEVAINDVKNAGGEVLGEPMEIPGIGKYVSFIDTEGNRVSLLQPVSM